MIKNKIALIVLCFLTICGCSLPSSTISSTTPISTFDETVSSAFNNSTFCGKQIYFECDSQTLPFNEVEIEFFQAEHKLICWYNSIDGSGNIKIFSLDSGKLLHSCSVPNKLINVYYSNGNDIIIISTTDVSCLSLSTFAFSDILTIANENVYGCDFSRKSNIMVGTTETDIVLTDSLTSETKKLISQSEALGAVKKQFNDTSNIPAEALPYFSLPRLLCNDRFVVLIITLPQGQTIFGGFCIIDLKTNEVKYYVESCLGGKLTVTDDSIISVVTSNTDKQLSITQIVLPDLSEKQVSIEANSYDENILVNPANQNTLHLYNNEGITKAIFLDAQSNEIYRQFTIDQPNVEGLLFTQDLFLFFTSTEDSKSLIAYLF